MKIPAWIVYLAAAVPIWCIAAGSFDVVQIAWSLLLGAATIPLVWRLLDLPRGLELGGFVREVASFLHGFFVLFVPDAIRSSLDMASRVIRPKIPMHPGIVAVPVRFDNATDALLLCNHVTLTPGQLVVSYDDERGVLYVHTIDARDPEAVRAGIQRLHRRARRWRKR